ncbi:MAG: PadR family transcriptional regulator [bacterium]|nr:PadR family transcriptional regulator [bacterium]
MDLLTRREEIILLSVWRLKNEAYGMTIKNHVSQATGKKWLFGSIYTPLEKLLEKGYLRSEKGDPTPERGGRAKVYFMLTKDGMNALQNLQRVYEFLWKDLPLLEAR